MYRFGTEDTVPRLGTNPQTILGFRATQLTTDVVIATRNRSDSLRRCLDRINKQTILPSQVVIVDSSTSSETQDLIRSLSPALGYPCRYQHSSIASAASQRNAGAAVCSSDLILFTDDDTLMDSNCISEIRRAFAADGDGRLAGVGATISNCVYVDPKGMNRLLLGLCIGRFRGSFAGKVVGPAVNFAAADGPLDLEEVEWLPTTCVAYRREIFAATRFEESFDGYSFAEDLHLSTRIARSFRLVTATRARVFHEDLGKDTHRDWVALGESQVRNRWLIMTSVFGKNRLLDNCRLFAYEIFYTAIAWIAAGLTTERMALLVRLLRGKLRGFWIVWTSGGCGHGGERKAVRSIHS